MAYTRPTYALMQKLAKHVRAQCVGPNDADHRVCMIDKLQSLLPSPSLGGGHPATALPALVQLAPTAFANQIIRVKAGMEWKKLVGPQAARLQKIKRGHFFRETGPM
jgi:hypothetical protein